MTDPLLYFWILLRASLLSTGMGNLPILYDDLLGRGWATDQQFVESLAVGQISPGPTGLWVVSLGYLMDGMRGAVLAALAITLPPLLVLAVERFHKCVGHHPAVEGFVRGLSLAVAGVFLVVAVNLLQGSAPDIGSAVIALITIGLAVTRRFPVIVMLGLAAALGVVLYS